MFKHFFPILLIITCAWSGARNAEASPVTSRGNVIRWNISEAAPYVTYYIRSTDASITTVVKDALGQWESVDSAYIAFTETGGPASAQITIELTDSLDNDSAAGQALRKWDDNGHITSCQIKVLSSSVTNQSYDQRLYIFAHETGHCVGLEHSVVKGSVMSYRPGGPRLTADDRYALTLLYPVGSEPVYPVGCATVGTNRGNSGIGTFAGLLLVCFGTYLIYMFPFGKHRVASKWHRAIYTAICRRYRSRHVPVS